MTMQFDFHEILGWYLVFVNVLAMLVFGWDKLCAKKGRWRVPELRLMLLALAGGSLGALLAMQLFRHKTLHFKFKYGIPLLLILQLAGLIYLHWPK